VANWNSINDDAVNNNATSDPLVDSTGAATSTTITFDGNDSWNNDTGAADVTTGDAKMMLGIIKTSAGRTVHFTFNNLAEGLYDVYLYVNSNGDGIAQNVSDWDSVTTHYIQETHQFTATSTYAEASNTDPSALRSVGNYVHFRNLNTAGRHQVGVVSTHISGGDGQGIAGLQLVNVGGPVVNAVPLNITVPPHNRRVLVGDSTVTVGVTMTGPSFFRQWYKNGAPIPGATDVTYTLPAIVAGDNNATFVFVATNNVNSVTSSPAKITIGKTVQLAGFALSERYNGKVRDDLESGSLDGVTPDVRTVLNSFEAPNGVADNYAQRVSGLFVPPVDGNYIFFVCSDDDSDLFLSSDSNPANKSLIASESAWSNALQWTTSAGNSDVAGKQSAPIALLAGHGYYIEGDHHEGGGGDNFEATFKLDTEADPADGSPSKIRGAALGKFIGVLDGAVVTVVSSPADKTVSAGNTASFTFSASSSITGDDFLPLPGINYQWQKKAPGAGTFTDIPGASGGNQASPASNTYTTPFLTGADSGTKYRVVITANDGSATTAEAALTVVSDNEPPVVVSAGGVKHDTAIEVSLVVDEPLDAAASLALSNFTLSSGTVTAAHYVTNASGFLSRQKGIVLSTTGLTAGSSYTLTVKGLKDISGNTSGSTTVPIKISSLTWTGLGNNNPDFPADVVSGGTNGFNVNAGGNSFWGTEDDVTFVYEKITGDFDKVVRVEAQDASSNWARAGLMVRESLDSLADTASRYQEVNADPAPIKFDGTPSNNQFESNRRLTTGGATDGAGSGGAPKYPNAWVRLRRVGSVIHIFRSDDNVTWTELGATNFDPEDGSGAPFAADAYVGMVYGPENGNVGDGFKSVWAARFRDYADYAPVNKPAGTQTYSIGVRFTDTSPINLMSPKDIAGVNAVAQANWNNSPSVSASTEPLALVADQGGVAKSSTATVEWSGSGNTWSSTGRGEENNGFTGPDHSLMTGYLDTGNATTTQVHVKGLPSALTTGKYDLIVYALGGVAGRGGSYRVLAADGTTVLKDYVAYQVFANPSTYVQVPEGTVNSAGDYIAFTGLSASEVIIEATTEHFAFSGTPRAPVNAVQFVTPSGLLNPVVNPEISLSTSGGTTTITFKGTLQSSDSVGGPYGNVAGATSPFTVNTGAAPQKFYRAHQ
jgi:hypothetical protein